MLFLDNSALLLKGSFGRFVEGNLSVKKLMDSDVDFVSTKLLIAYWCSLLRMGNDDIMGYRVLDISISVFVYPHVQFNWNTELITMKKNCDSSRLIRTLDQLPRSFPEFVS